jgi:hypothetical protein
MRLKSEPEQAVHDLGRREQAEWLGYRLSQGDGRLKVNLTEDAWRSLSKKLGQAHDKADSPTRANEAIRGWLSQLGPCFEDENIHQTHARIGSLAHKLAFDEIPSKEAFRQSWQHAYQRWCRKRKVRGEQGGAKGGAARPVREPAATRGAGTASSDATKQRGEAPGGPVPRPLPCLPDRRSRRRRQEQHGGHDVHP